MIQKFRTELLIAIESVLEAGKFIHDVYHSEFSVKYKSKDDPVTLADSKANISVQKIIKKNFPKDAILSEESPDLKSRIKNKRVWILDPLDGTREFVNKNPEFAISLGLVVDSKPILGVIFNPIQRELFYGIVGFGVGKLRPLYPFQRWNQELNFDKFIYDNLYVNKKKLTISVSEYNNGLFQDDYWIENFYLTKVGSIAYKLALVALGKFDLVVSVSKKNEWDICAGVALVIASGGVCFDFELAQSFRFNKNNLESIGIIAGNPADCKKIIKDFRIKNKGKSK